MKSNYLWRFRLEWLTAHTCVNSEFRCFNPAVWSLRKLKAVFVTKESNHLLQIVAALCCLLHNHYPNMEQTNHLFLEPPSSLPYRSSLRSLTNILHFPFVNACSLSFILLHTSGLEQHRIASVPDSKNHPTIPRHRPRVVLCAIKNWNVVFPPLETFPRCCKGQFSLSTWVGTPTSSSSRLHCHKKKQIIFI